MDYAKQIQIEMEATQREVKELTLISVDDQRARMMESGLDWLEMITGNDRACVQIGSTHEFWGFWKTVWMHADKAFTTWANHAILNGFMDQYEVGKHYDTFHRISFDNNWINTPATESGYHVLIKRLAVKR